ncbi:Acetyl-coenzyme A synthetase [Streptomyces microflavus]
MTSPAPPRRSDLDRELRGQGIANTLTGLLGGLPVAGGVVRGSANVRAGATGRASTVLHGVWVLLAAGLLITVFEWIPLAALAALVMVVGVQMVSFAHIRNVHKHREFPVYAATVAGVVAFGALAGVALGVGVAVIVSLHRLGRTKITATEQDGRHVVTVHGQLTFLAVPRLTRTLGQLPPGVDATVELDGFFMDHAAYEAIQAWRGAQLAQGGRIDFTGRSGSRIAEPAAAAHSCCRPWTPWRNHHCHDRPTRPADNSGTTDSLPDSGSGSGTSPTAGAGRKGGAHRLLSGLSSFQRNTAPLVRDELARVASEGQCPSQLFITCADTAGQALRAQAGGRRRRLPYQERRARPRRPPHRSGHRLDRGPRRLVARDHRPAVRRAHPRGLRGGAAALHPLHLGHHREAEGHPAHLRRLPHPGGVHAPRGLRPQAGDRCLLVHRRCRLGHRTLVHRHWLLANGVTQVTMQGTPDTPHQGRFWEIVQKYGVTILYMVPTVIRTFMKWDDIPAKFEQSSLRILGSVGEPINPEAWMWYRKHIGADKCPIVDTWWQTETGAMMIAPLPGVTATKPGSAQRALPGIAATVVDDDANEVPKAEAATSSSPSPGPPCSAPSGATTSGSSTPTGRASRASTSRATVPRRMRTATSGCSAGSTTSCSCRATTARPPRSIAFVSHPSVAEAAVVGAIDGTTGQAIVAFVILRGTATASDELVAELRNHVGMTLGPIAKPKRVLPVAELPKTRSGKIMRRLLRDVAENRELGDVTTLTDSSVMDLITTQPPSSSSED